MEQPQWGIAKLFVFFVRRHNKLVINADLVMSYSFPVVLYLWTDLDMNWELV
jgi:hypothetical protein